MNGLENIKAALAEANKRVEANKDTSVQTEQTSSDRSQNSFVDEVVPYTSANKETMYSGK